MKVPVDIALWYCVSSPWILERLDGADPNEDRLRSLSNVIRFILPVLDLFDYNYDRVKVLRYTSLYNGFHWVRNQLLQDQQAQGQVSLSERASRQQRTSKKTRSTVPRKVAYAQYLARQVNLQGDLIIEDPVVFADPVVPAAAAAAESLPDLSVAMDIVVEESATSVERMEISEPVVKPKITFSQKIKSVYQNCVMGPDHSIVFTDGSATKESTKNVHFPKFKVLWDTVGVADATKQADLGLRSEDLFKIYNSFDLQGKKSDFQLDATFDTVDLSVLPAPQTLYHYKTTDLPRLEICPATMRPFSNIENKSWKECALEMYGDSILNCTHDYGRFVQKYKTYPTESTFLTFLQSKHKNSTLPIHILSLIQATLLDFESAVSNVSPEEFIVRFKASQNPAQRAAMDGTSSSSMSE
jgi:hypothetical protein